IATASSDDVPRAWLDQLAPGGLVVMPLRLAGRTSMQALPTFERVGSGLRSTAMGACGFMALRSDASEAGAISPTVTIAWSCGEYGAGVVSDDGAGVTVVSDGSSLTWGAGTAADRLDALVDAWRALGRPAAADLRIDVEWSGRSRRAWRTLRRGASTMYLDW